MGNSRSSRSQNWRRCRRVQGLALALCASADLAGSVVAQELEPEPIMTHAERMEREAEQQRQGVWFIAGAFLAHAIFRQLRP